MAIQFNPNALSIFANVNFGQTDAIANLNGGKDGLVQKGTRGLGLLAWARSGKTQDRNNAVRTEFLKALGQAFNIKGVSEDDGGKTTFSDGFMDRLEKLLGPEIFKRADFGINADGEVKSGRPLTQRRIRAIVNAARVKGNADSYDGKTYLAKLDHITDWIKGKGGKDPASTRAVLDYFDGKVRKTIDFLDNVLNGLDTSKMGVGDFSRYIEQQTGLAVDVKQLVSNLEEENDIENPANDRSSIIDVDDLFEIPQNQSQPIKTEVRKLLESLVKQSVDRCLEAIDADDDQKFGAVVDAVTNNNDFASVILCDLDKLEPSEIDIKSEDDESDDGGPNFFEFNIDRDKPIDGNHAVGKAGDVKFETPDFVKDLPEATQKEFMAFYKAAVNKSIAGGVWKENCDSALKALFDKIGGDPDERKVLVELIAGGKAGFLDGGKVPSLEDALAYAAKVKPVLQKIVQYSKDNGEEFAHVVLATVKSMDELVSADDLMPIEKQELGDIRDGADLFVNNYHFSNVTSAEELSGKLTSFKEDVLKTFNTRCPGSANGCTPAMLAVKKNYYLYMAFNKMELRGYFAGLLEKYYKDLVTTHGQKELVDMILPQFEKRFELVIDRDF